MPVAFNTDRAQAAASCRRLAGLDADIACFGHGEPVSRDAAAHLQAAARQLICRRRRGSSSAGGGAAAHLQAAARQSAITNSEIAAGRHREHALPEYANPPVASRFRAELHQMTIRHCMLLRH
jgi:hypothetical protein